MFKSHRLFSSVAIRSVVISIAGIFFMTMAAAAASAEGFSIVGSLQGFFGLQEIERTNSAIANRQSDAVAPSTVAPGFSNTGFLDVFCGGPAVWRPADRVVLPPHEVPVTVPVTIADFSFTPADLTIHVGDTVMWTNNGPHTHTTTSDTAVWDSGNVTAGNSFSFTFNSPGIFPYHCNIHNTMTAVVRVVGPFTPGNIVVYRIGDGSAALTAVATPVFLDEYTTAGAFVQTISMPTAVNG